jgi:hypothetical protein
MEQVQFFAEVRELIGNPNQTDIPDRRLRMHAEAALEKLAQVLKYSLKEDTVSLELVADQQEYDLPADVTRIMWMEYNGTKLSVASTSLWDRDGVTWRSPTSGIPAEYAIEGRKVIFDRPPSSTTVAAAKRVTYKYVSSSPGLALTGIPFLPEADARLAVLLTAQRWCIANPSQENGVRLNGINGLLAMDMGDALERHEKPVEEYQPGFGVHTGRQGAAR